MALTAAQAIALRNAGAVPVFATDDGRDAVMPSPAIDQLCINIEQKALQRFTSGAWVRLAVLDFASLSTFTGISASTIIINGDPDAGTTAPFKMTGLFAWDGDLRPINDKDNNIGSLTKRILAFFGTNISLSNAAGNNRYLAIYTDSSKRWETGGSSTAESGSNVGTDYRWVAYDDSGASLGTYLTLTRSTGALTLGNDMTARRYKGSGTAHVAGDYALGAGWGNTATVSAIAARDTGGRVTITCGGTGIAANPTVALTFKNGTWSTAPAVIGVRGDTNATAGYWVLSSISATVATWTFVGTPTSGEVYVLDFIGMGK